MTETHCPYCHYDEYDIIAQNEYGVVLPEPNSLSKGHCVIIPKRHVASFFDITDKERKSLMTLLEQARNELTLHHQPAGFHVGFNDGDVFAEQSSHIHIHIIPRYAGTTLKLDARWGIEDQ